MTSTQKFIGSASRVVLRRLVDAAITLVVIAFLALFGLIMAERGRAHVPAPLLSVTGEAVARTVDYLTAHPTSYLWHKVDEPALGMILRTFGRSAGLLLVALGLATLAGVALGMAMALSRRKISALAMLGLSILGVSTPSFLLAMALWIINIQVHRRFAITVLPPTGFGWDQHLVMPALVLAARPLAQIAQVTYVAMSEVLTQDYIRTADAKGLSERLVVIRHAVPNVLVPVLTTLGTSLRFSLASLPVVEYFFVWPGVGLVLLEAIGRGMTSLVTDLIVSLGLFFLLINLLLEVVYPLLDPRLIGARDGGETPERQRGRWELADLASFLAEWWHGLRNRLARKRPAKQMLPPLPNGAASLIQAARDEPLPLSASRRVVRSALGNPILLIGTLLILAFAALAIFGEKLSTANPYQIHGVMMIEGTIGAPPYPPSSVFPWGADHIGRDLQALVLAGARQTLTLALFGTAARLLLGACLGLLAGWWHGGRFDRFVTGAVGVWAAFPVTLFAMILIQGLGIQQGMWVFIVALCVVGWGEVAQFVRRQVMSIQPELYIEAARSVGARATRILTQHVLLHLLSPLLVLGVLEMGGVLMLLAELGFLNVFLGGGFKVEMPSEQVASFSDVPEWGAMLANIRDWWRSYPWMAWYPGGAFFLAILAFNLWGEGLRRFLNDSRINVSRLINRYSVVALAVVAVGLIWMLRTATPLGIYQAPAREFNATAALADIEALTSPEYQGRESGMPGAEMAAQYIAQRMADIGLFPAGDKNTFIQTSINPRAHLVGMPTLALLDAQGNGAETFVYRQDFVEYAGPPQHSGRGAIVGVGVGPDPGTPGADPYQFGNRDLYDKVILVPDPADKRINLGAAAGVLLVSDDPMTFQRRELFRNERLWEVAPPVMTITPETADRLLATTGSSLVELRRLTATLGPGEVALTAPGAVVDLEIPLVNNDDLGEKYYNVIGFIPGTGALMGERKGQGLDSQVIMVGAYYDGLGTGPDGTFYPGANDNASGVAALLEMARALKQSPYEPKKTVVFVAWSGGERGEGLSVTNVMNAKIGFSSLTVEAVIELSGVGAGDGRAIALGEGSSYRLVKLYQQAASRIGAPTTTRGRGPHYGMPTQSGFGGRDALTLHVSWDGSDRTAHTTQDTFAAIDPEKLRQVGQTTLLTLNVLAREVSY